MHEVEKFLTPDEEAEIIAAIQTAERNSSGEIRVHIEAHSVSQKDGSILDPFDRAAEVFALLKMNNTQQRNGTLLYIAVVDRKLVIMGDEGINKVVEHDFWEGTINLIVSHFKNNEIKNGIVKGILKVGEKLKQYFPYQTDDKNELPDDISFG